MRKGRSPASAHQLFVLYKLPWHASFVRALRHAVNRTNTKTHECSRRSGFDAGRIPAAGPLIAHALDRGRTHPARPSHRLLRVTAANSRSVWSFRPPVG